MFSGNGHYLVGRPAPDTDFREVADMSERLDMRACLRSGAENGEHLSGDRLVATAETAAVRILVINSLSMIVIGSPVSGLKRPMSARSAGIPVPALPG